MSASWPLCLRSAGGSGGLSGQRLVSWWTGIVKSRTRATLLRCSLQRRQLHHTASALCCCDHRHASCDFVPVRPLGSGRPHRRFSSSTSSSSSSHSSLPLLSPREEEAMAALQRIPHPSGSGDDIVYSGSVVGLREKDGELQLTLLLDAHYREIRQRVQAQLTQQLPWLRSLRVSMDAAAPSASASPSSSSASPAAAAHSASNLSAVRDIIAVSSCKGGVGKSVVAVNLAYSLSSLGLRVGLLDADLFGPSLPTMIAGGRLAGSGIHYGSDGSSIEPYDYKGVKTMSYGYAAAAASASTPSSPSTSPSPSPHAANVMRGPIASTLIRDLLTRTAWSTLDFLIIDCPPGTSDILLTLTQTARISAAVVVTTPQRLAYVDVMKGLHMFAAVQVEVAALVENMSWTRCGGCGQQRRLFGQGHMEEMRAELQRMRQERSQRGAAAAAAAATEAELEPAVLEYRLPIAEEISEWSDRGEPFVLTTGGGEEAQAARETYGRMARELHARMQLKRSGRETAGAEAGKRVRWEPDSEWETTGGAGGGLLVMEGSGSLPVWVDAFLLRAQCRCAACVDERTGQRTARGRATAGVRVQGLQVKGNYAVAIHWSDGHASSIYTYDQIAELGSASREEARQAGAAAMQLQQQQLAAVAG